MASKNTTRRPVETDPWDLTEAIAATEARLERAIDTAHRADIELAEAAARLIALQARDRFPAAWTVVLEWSDQGDHLSVSGLAGVFDEPLTVDEDAWNAFLDDGADSCAANLSGHTEYVWLPFMRPLDRARNSIDPYHLNILNTVGITEATTTPKPSTPEEPHAVDNDTFDDYDADIAAAAYDDYWPDGPDGDYHPAKSL